MNLTVLAIISVIGISIVYDILAYILWGLTYTISYQVTTASYLHPAIPFAAGLLAGHLFWTHRP